MALLASFLIPVWATSLRGLTHLLLCETELTAAFTLVVDAEGPPVVVSSDRVGAQLDGVCGSLDVAFSVSETTPEEFDLTVSLANTTDRSWLGTVQLELDELVVPVAVGTIGPGETVTETVALRLPVGFHELTGALLVGP